MISRCDFEGMGAAIRSRDVEVMQLWRCKFRNVDLALGGSVRRLETKYCRFHEASRGVNAYMLEPVFEHNDFHGKGMAISQLAPQSVQVDDNFFDTTNPVEMLERLQGPCVFRGLYQKPSTEKSRVTLFPGDYRTYRQMGSEFYEQRAWDSALRSYLRAWWMHKEREVGQRLIGILRQGRGFGSFLRQDQQFRDLAQRSERLKAAMHVAHTLTIMFPDDRELRRQYADLLEANGFPEQTEKVRSGANRIESSSL